MTFLASLASRNDPRFHLTSFGKSPEGRELPLVVMSSYSVKTPAEARKRGLPVVLVINGIHAGEVEGKEASLALMRDLLDDRHANNVHPALVRDDPLAIDDHRTVEQTRHEVRKLFPSHDHGLLGNMAPESSGPVDCCDLL